MNANEIIASDESFSIVDEVPIFGKSGRVQGESPQHVSVQRFDPGLHPREEETANGWKLGREQGQHRQSSKRDDANVEIGADFAGLSVGDAAQDGILGHLSEHNSYARRQRCKNWRERPADGAAGEERVGAEREHDEDKSSNNEEQ